MVSPPIALASTGVTDSTPSATSSIASGRQTVCFESMNQFEPATRLEDEVTTFHRVLEQMFAERLELGRGRK